MPEATAREKGIGNYSAARLAVEQATFFSLSPQIPLLNLQISPLPSQQSFFLSGSKVVEDPFPANYLSFYFLLYLSLLTQTFLPQTCPYAPWKRKEED